MARKTISVAATKSTLNAEERIGEKRKDDIERGPRHLTREGRGQFCAERGKREREAGVRRRDGLWGSRWDPTEGKKSPPPSTRKQEEAALAAPRGRKKDERRRHSSLEEEGKPSHRVGEVGDDFQAERLGLDLVDHYLLVRHGRVEKARSQRDRYM